MHNRHDGSMRGTATRRRLLQAAGLAGLGVAMGTSRDTRAKALTRAQATPEPLAEAITIDLTSEPPSLDPAIVYDVNGWSVVHSIYDSLVQYGPTGELEPLLAESLTQLDPLTYEIKLRRGVRFHNGEPFDARSVVFSIEHILAEETASQVAQNFQVIEQVEVIDPYTVRLHLSQPAPWLPAQMAAWLAMLPPEYAADPANDFGRNPVGTGPYRFVEWEPGERIVLEANPDYFAASPKGRPAAEQVIFRTVPEASTRVADLLAGEADLIADLPVDQIEAVREGGAEVVSQAIPGIAFIRIASDVEPFSDVRVRQALNYAVDVEGIIEALLGGEGERLASLFPPGGLGHDPALDPYPYDPDQARALLAEAGYPEGFETTLEYVSGERPELVEAIAGQLEAVGIRTKLQPVEKATFNQTWADPEAAPLRFLTWRPLFDPYTLLSLVVAGEGFLSRYDNTEANALIAAGAAEPDPEQREAIYQDLGRLLHEDAPAVFLYDLTSHYGLSDELAWWRPRPDEYVIPTKTA